ncbi:MAK10-like protein [Tanacetum coccineum]
MGDENPIRTLEDYSKPSHKGYRNTIELPEGNNMVPLRSDTIRLEQNGCSFQDFASNWLERLPAGSISTWEDLTPHFLAQFFPPGRTAQLHNDILMFQQHQGESIPEAWTRFKDLLQKVPHYGIDLWLQALLEDLALYDSESWNDPKDFAKPVKAISLPQDVLSTSDRHLFELENQVQRLMEAHLAPKQLVQVHNISSLCEICSGPHDTQYCMENPEQAFVEYASSRTDEAGDKPFQKDQLQTVMEIGTQRPEEPGKTLEDEFKDLHLNLPVLEVLDHAPMYNAILDKYVKSLELGKNGSAFIQGKMPKRMEDLKLSTLPCRLRDSKPFDTLADLGSCVNIISLYLFKNLKIGLLEETDHVFGLADGTKSYPVGIVRDVEVHIGRLLLLNDYYVIDMKKDPETPLLVGRGFLATANAVIDYRKAKMAVGEGITRLIFGVKETDPGEEEAPY